MEIGETQPIAGKLVNIRCLDLAAKTAQVTETQVICNDDKEVGSFGFVDRLHVAVKLRVQYTSTSKNCDVGWNDSGILKVRLLQLCLEVSLFTFLHYM